MVYDILEVFKKLYEKEKDGLILGAYSLKDGLYIKVGKKGELDYFVVNKGILTDLKGRQSSKQYEWFKQVDYHSSYLNSNKALFDKKIHNINYLSMFFKAENTDYVKNKIREHFLTLLSFKKFKDKKEKEILSNYEDYIKKFSRKKEIVKKFRILESIFDVISDKVKELDIKNYVKIFFEEDMELYKKESEIYLSLKIFNDIKYSEKIDDSIYGLSNANMGLNSKKPYLENKTQTLNIPFMIENENALMLKKFFDWLKLQPYRDKENKPKDRYLDEDHFFMQKHSKNDESEITDFDYIPLKSDDVRKQFKPIYVKNYLKIEKNKELVLDYEVKELWELEKKVDEVFYNKQLIFNYYKEGKDIKVSDFLSKELQTIILTTRYSMNNYFRKYYRNEKDFYNHIKRFGRDFVFEYLKEKDEKKYFYALQKAKEVLNLKLALKKHYEGVDMDIEKEIQNVRELLVSKEYPELNKNDFLFLSGQWAYYLLSLSKADKKNKTFSFAERYFKAKTSQKIQDILKIDLEKYKHAIRLNNSKAKKAIALLKAYEVDDKLNGDDKDRFLVGFTVENIFYESNEKENNNEEQK
jgi:CRISPR-associated protein Csh1